MDKQPRWEKKPFRVCKILLNIQGLGRSQSESAYCPDKESPSSQPWQTQSKGQLKCLECFPISGNFCYYNMQFSGCCLKNKIFQPSRIYQYQLFSCSGSHSGLSPTLRLEDALSSTWGTWYQKQNPGLLHTKHAKLDCWVISLGQYQLSETCTN